MTSECPVLIHKAWAVLGGFLNIAGKLATVMQVYCLGKTAKRTNKIISPRQKEKEKRWKWLREIWMGLGEPEGSHTPLP